MATNHGLFQPGHLLLSWSPRTRELTSRGFPPVSRQRFVADAEAVTSLAVSSSNGLVYGSVSSGQLFAFDVDERQVVERWEMRSKGTPLMGVPETYGVIHLTCGHDSDSYGVTQSDLYQIVEGKPGVFYIGACGHLLEYHLKDTGHYR